MAAMEVRAAILAVKGRVYLKSQEEGKEAESRGWMDGGFLFPVRTGGERDAHGGERGLGQHDHVLGVGLQLLPRPLHCGDPRGRLISSEALISTYTSCRRAIHRHPHPRTRRQGAHDVGHVQHAVPRRVDQRLPLDDEDRVAVHAQAALRHVATGPEGVCFLACGGRVEPHQEVGARHGLSTDS